MRFFRLLFIIFSLSFFIQPKEAQAQIVNPVARGFVVGGSTIGLMTAGAAIGTATGLASSAGGFEGIAFAMFGATLGAAVGAPVGVILTSKPAGIEKNIVLRDTLIATGLFVGATFTGYFTGTYVLTLLGWSGILVVPIIAGVSAAHNPHSATVQITPVLSPEYKGIVASYRF
ncbi:MAG: hypothetical protein VX278_01930 [Myxococcota bacterium]|nr:hypothetical protein [Myxococcota bacterium]